MDNWKEKYKKIADKHPYFFLSFAFRGTVKESQKEEFELLQEALKRVGVRLENIEDNECVYIGLDYDEYVKKTYRGSGGKKKRAYKDKSYCYKYKDILEMIESGMKDKEIADKIGMPIATYRRHKKKMLESDLYNRYRESKLHFNEYAEQEKNLITINYIF